MKSAALSTTATLFISHGAPMLFEMTDWMTRLLSWAGRCPTRMRFSSSPHARKTGWQIPCG